MLCNLGKSVAWFLVLGLMVNGLAPKASSQPPRKGQGPGLRKDTRPVAPPAPRSALLTREAWQNAPLSPLEPGEIDALVLRELRRDDIQPAPLTTDEQFLRRVTLDLTGHLPLPADVAE